MPAEQPAATTAAANLAVERQWLGSWFKDTPVVVAQREAGTVTVDVPREFCFEPGRVVVKPALAAVLGKLAESMRRLPLAELSLVAAPADASGAAQLGMQRAVRIQDYLRTRGVPAERLGKPSVSTGTAVHLRIDAAPLP